MTAPLMPLPILLHPHKGLQRPAQSVVEVSAQTRATLQQLLHTMYTADGVGLAANQVGIYQRLVVIDIGHDGPDGPTGKRDYSRKDPRLLINPQIIAQSDEHRSWQEGCLSLPGLYADVERPAAVTVRYLNEHGHEKTEDAEGLLAVCLQHEIDHLDGILFPQRMSKLRRQLAEKKYVKKRADWLAEPTYPFTLEKP